MSATYDSDMSAMLNRLLERSNCKTIEELTIFLKKSQKIAIRLVNDDISLMIYDLTKHKMMGKSLATILFTQNIEPLFITYGNDWITHMEDDEG